MNPTLILRRALWATAIWNLGGALGFIFPESFGQLADFPLPVSPFYSWFIAFVILLFGGMYAWLARQTVIDRALVVLATLGKTGFFAIALISWLLGELTLRGVALAGVDMIFVAIFVWWLGQSQQAPNTVRSEPS